MIDAIGSVGPGPMDGATKEEARLRKLAAEVEGVFMQQMFKAMRSTVPSGGLSDAGQGEAIFTGMLDEHIADIAAARQKRGLGDALYRQLVTRLDPASDVPSGSGSDQ